MRLGKNEMADLRNASIDFMHSLWGKDCVGNCETDMGTENFEILSKIIFSDLTEGKKISRKPFMFRTGGQSGSGKTTQIMPSIKNVIDAKGLDFVNISVRVFAKYHPHYNALLEEFGEDMIREKTNGFALMMLFRIMEMLMEKKYNILLEVTILDEKFEEYLSRFAKQSGYNIHFHVLSVPFEKSSLWIEKRKNNSRTEGNRTVLKSSSNYFYEVLPRTLEKLLGFDFWEDDEIFLWNGFDFDPVLCRPMENCDNFMKMFHKYRDYVDFEEADEARLLDAKKQWFRKYYAERI